MDVEGTVGIDLDSIRQAFQKNFDEFGEIGASLAVFKDGECVVDLWGGHRDGDRTVPWTKDTLANVWSTTKGPTAICVAKLVQDGTLDYDETVASHWPEFAQNGKADITVAQMMSHQAGLCGLRDPITVEAFYDHDAMASQLAAQEPFWEPGTRSGYHAITYGFLAGELVRRATGKSLGTYFADEFAVPLDIDFYIGLPEREEHRIAEMIASPNPDADRANTATNDIIKAALTNPRMSADYPNVRAWRAAEIPAAGGQGTAYGIAKLYGLLAHATTGDSASPLTSEGLAAMTAKQIENKDAVLGLDTRWGAGVILNNSGIYGPNGAAFGHSGWGGSFGAYDPVANVGIGYVMNQMGDDLDPRAINLVRAVFEAL